MTAYLVAVDFGECSLRAFAWAAARAQQAGATLSVLHVLAPAIPPPSDTAFGAVPSMLGSASQTADVSAAMRALKGVTQGAQVSCTEQVRVGDIVGEIVQAVGEQQPDLLVMGSHGRSGVERFVMGSVSEAVLRRVACPVMVVPKGAHDSGEFGAVGS